MIRNQRLAIFVTRPVMVVACLLTAQLEAAENTSTPPGPTLEKGSPAGLPLDTNGREKYNAGWTFAFDNDLFAFARRDLDYTGGMALTFAGRRAREWPWSLDRPIDLVQRLLPTVERTPGVAPLHALQVGLLAFTPERIEEPTPIFDDRPYASLLFAGNSRTYITKPDAPVYEASFIFGLLGLEVAEKMQKGIHDLVGGSTQPQGWDYQISDGGEPTLRWVLARQALLASDFQRHSTEYEVKWRIEASVGYLTETSLAFTARFGRINTPWWSFTPERADYISQPSPVIGNALRSGARELYLWGGIKIRARAYNVFLQGQFRDSVVELDRAQIEPFNLEAWLGMTWQMTSQFRLGYVLRLQTQELQSDLEDRDLIWGGLLVSRDL